MAASTTKQQNYRRLMKEAKVKSSSQPKKVDHPLARYNALDQLTCIVCGVPIKSELLWSTHIKSRRHKESVAELKSRKEELLSQQNKKPRENRVERRAEEELDQKDGEDPSLLSQSTEPAPKLTSVLKKTRRTDDSGSDSISSDSTPPPAKKHRVTFNDVVDVNTMSERPQKKEIEKEKKKKEEEEEEKMEEVEKKDTKSSLPSDFFDAGVSKKFGEDETEDGHATSSRDNSSTSAPEISQPAIQSEGTPKDSAIPEGFFDDPKMDAKIRKVEYKDKMEEEWEKFQKTIQKENDVSEAIIFEDEEEAQGERNFSEIKEQVECFQKAEQLRVKQEQLLQRRRDSSDDGSSSSRKTGPPSPEAKEVEVMVVVPGEEEETDSDELSDDELEMDWRARHS